VRPALQETADAFGFARLVDALEVGRRAEQEFHGCECAFQLTVLLLQLAQFLGDRADVSKHVCFETSQVGLELDVSLLLRCEASLLLEDTDKLSKILFEFIHIVKDLCVLRNHVDPKENFVLGGLAERLGLLVAFLDAHVGDDDCVVQLCIKQVIGQTRGHAVFSVDKECCKAVFYCSGTLVDPVEVSCAQKQKTFFRIDHLNLILADFSVDQRRGALHYSELMCDRTKFHSWFRQVERPDDAQSPDVNVCVVAVRINLLDR